MTEKIKNVNEKKRFSKIAVLFLVSEILILLMVAGFIMTEVVFPLSDMQKFEMYSHWQKWSPRLVDNIVTVFGILSCFAIFFMSAAGIVLSVKSFRKKQASAKKKLVFIIMCINLILSGVTDFFVILDFAFTGFWHTC